MAVEPHWCFGLNIREMLARATPLTRSIRAGFALQRPVSKTRTASFGSSEDISGGAPDPDAEQRIEQEEKTERKGEMPLSDLKRLSRRQVRVLEKLGWDLHDEKAMSSRYDLYQDHVTGEIYTGNLNGDGYADDQHITLEEMCEGPPDRDH